MTTDYEALLAERYGPTGDQLAGRRRLAECVREADAMDAGEWVPRHGIKVWRTVAEADGTPDPRRETA